MAVNCRHWGFGTCSPQLSTPWRFILLIFLRSFLCLLPSVWNRWVFTVKNLKLLESCFSPMLVGCRGQSKHVLSKNDENYPQKTRKSWISQNHWKSETPKKLPENESPGLFNCDSPCRSTQTRPVSCWFPAIQKRQKDFRCGSQAQSLLVTPLRRASLMNLHFR